MGGATLDQVKGDFEDRQSSGEFVEVAHPDPTAPQERIRPKRRWPGTGNIDMMKGGQDKTEPIARLGTLDYLAQRPDKLNEKQRGAVEQILSNDDKIEGIQGTAGAGKTTSLEAIREGAD